MARDQKCDAANSAPQPASPAKHGAPVEIRVKPGRGHHVSARRAKWRALRLQGGDCDDHGPGRQTDPHNSPDPERQRAAPERAIRQFSHSARRFRRSQIQRSQKIGPRQRPMLARPELSPPRDQGQRRDQRVTRHAEDREAPQFVESSKSRRGRDRNLASMSDLAFACPRIIYIIA